MLHIITDCETQQETLNFLGTAVSYLITLGFVVQGEWILLQNSHLGLTYMNELFMVLTETKSCHDDFRVWITTEEHVDFPISLLQISIKFTNEPPQG